MKKSTNKLLFLTLIASQLMIIFALLIWIQHKKNNVLGQSISEINKEDIQIVKNSKYKYFYEPKPGGFEIIQPPWQTNNLPTYTINSNSLNERYDYSIKKPDKTYRIITLGDSFTFGQYISTEKNWTEVLEDYLNKNTICENITKYEVINLGVYGYDTTYQVERYRLRGQKYDPDLVIWFVTDLHRITEKYMEIYNQLAKSNKEKVKKDYHYTAWKNIQNILIKKYGKKTLIDYQLDKFREFRKKYYPSGPILFMTELEDLYELGNNDIYYSKTGVIYKNKYLLPDKHFNENGHKEFSNEVIEALIKYKIIPC